MTKVYAIAGVEFNDNLLAVASTLEAAKAWAMDHLMNVALLRYVGADPDSASVEEVVRSGRTYMILHFKREAFGNPEYKYDYLLYIEAVDFVE